MVSLRLGLIRCGNPCRSHGRAENRSSALYFENCPALAHRVNAVENRFPPNLATSTKAFAVNRGAGRRWAVLLATACSAFLLARAESVHSLTGWIPPVVTPYDRYGQFVVLHDPLDVGAP